MPNNRKKIKDEVWIGAFIGVIILWGMLADWWKTHAILGWTFLVLLLGGAGYAIYRYAYFRGWLGRQVKSTIEQVVYENKASEREPLTPYERNAILKRAKYRCENDLCDFRGKPHIHHIDMKNDNNNFANLIALCPNCHQKAHDGKFSASQLYNWAKRDYKRLQTRIDYH